MRHLNSLFARCCVVLVGTWLTLHVPGARGVIYNSVDVDLNITDITYFDISIDGVQKGRIVMGLYGNTFPLAVKNFRVLCSGLLGYGYKGTKFFRVLPDVMISGGAMGVNEKGFPIGRSIYDDLPIQMEDIRIPMDTPGQLFMSTDRFHKASSKFGIVSSKTASMEPLLAIQEIAIQIFGQVLEGLEIVWEINDSNEGDEDNQEMKHDVEITDSGVLKTNKKNKKRSPTSSDSHSGNDNSEENKRLGSPRIVGEKQERAGSTRPETAESKPGPNHSEL